MNTHHNISQYPILIYYNFRGQLQPLRNFLCYLEIPFFQIHLERLEQQKEQLPTDILEHFRKFKIDKSQLPSLIHQELLIEGHLPIMTYICRKYNRNELLGENMQTRAKLQQMLDIYFTKQPQSMLQFFKVADYAAGQNHSFQQILEYRYRQLISVLESGYIKPICEYLSMQNNPRYILGKITLLDFFFIQTCFYMVGCFDTKEQSYILEKRQNNIKRYVHEQKQANFYFKIMENYQSNFSQQYFLIQDKDFLQSFPINSTMTNPERTKGLRKIWLGDPKMIH